MMRQVGIATILVLALGCGGSAGGSTDPGPAPGDVVSEATDPGPAEVAQDAPNEDVPPVSITISGTLEPGGQSLPGQQSSALSTASALAGYQLYCMVLATPPVAASGTADDSGSVSLTIAGGGASIGCFILDPEGNGVASLLFTSGSSWGQTARLDGDADLGIITVDLKYGVAQASLPTDGNLAASDDLSCPLGTWQATNGPSGCTSAMQVTYWIARTSDGQYVVSFTTGPLLLDDDVTCGQMSFSNLPATWDGTSLHFVVMGDRCSGTGGGNATFTPDADCTHMTVDMAWHDCGYCSEQGECKDCGTADCNAPFGGSGTRQ